MRDMHPAAWTQLAHQTDHRCLNRYADMFPVRCQYLTTAFTQRTAIKYILHIYITGPPFIHTVHSQETHRRRLQQEHVRKTDAGLDQIRLAFQV